MRWFSLAAVVLVAGAKKCLNVDVGPNEGGQNTCFTGDEMGMVCGWDDTPDEAYCTADAGGVKVCARAGACVWSDSRRAAPQCATA